MNTKLFLTRILFTGVFITMILFNVSLCPVQGDTSSSAPVTGLDLVLKDTPLRTALQIIAEGNGFMFSSNAKLDERVNVNMRGASFDEAVDQLLSNRPYNWVKENKTLRVFKAAHSGVNTEDLATAGAFQQNQKVEKEKPEVKEILVLKQRRPDEIVAIIAPLAADVRMVADIRTNTILMSGNADSVKKIKKIAVDLDEIQTIEGMEEKKEFVSEVFALDYISDFDDLAKNLNFILYGSTQALDSSIDTNTNNSPEIAGQIVEQPTVPVRKEYYLLDKVRRMLMITASYDKMEIIREYFAKVNTPLPQVLIEAHIVALDEGFERSAGINWNFAGTYQGPVRPTDKPLGAPDTSNIAGGTQIDPAEGFQFGQWNLGSLIATLEMAQAKNKGKILSQPKLMTLSGNPAKIHIGTRYPYKASTTLNQSGGTAENIQYVDVGILLNVVPQVNTKSGTIVMKIAPEVSDVVGFRNDAPIITSRQTDTVVEVADGKTVVIGGLLRDEDMKSKSGVPILREIPVIGEFFRFSSKNKNKTNLIIMITPKVVNVRGQTRDEEEAEAEEIRLQNQENDPTRLQSLVEKLRNRVKSRETK